MGPAAAKSGDAIEAKDTRQVNTPGQPPSPRPFTLKGSISSGLSENVKILGQPAAIVGSNAAKPPDPFPPLAPGESFAVPPTDGGRIVQGSGTVRINKAAAARDGDLAQATSETGTPLPAKVVATGTTVRIG
jgi:uncharacterized Zn-binding protein involved in type VI secretion